MGPATQSLLNPAYPLAPIARWWGEAGIESEYVEAMRLALASQEASTSCPVHGNSALLSLPGLCCEAAGGARVQRGVENVTAAWCLLYRAAHLFDHIADGDVAPNAAPAFSPGQSLNIAVGMMTSASLALCALGENEAAHDIRRDFYRTGLEMCAGQHAGLTVREPTLAQCWQIAEARSGTFFALACRAGARLAESHVSRLVRFGEFGCQLGVLIQIGDDLTGLGPAAGERSDLAAGRRWTLPVAYAMSVMPGSDRKQLQELLRAAPGNADAEAQARRRIIESGAVLYLTIEAERCSRRAEAALKAAAPPSPAREELLALLQQVLPRVNGEGSSASAPESVCPFHPGGGFLVPDRLGGLAPGPAP